MVAWEMADGTEIRYEGAGVEPAALREFVVRSMSALGSFWDGTQRGRTGCCLREFA
jgi:hypothetical protein